MIDVHKTYSDGGVTIDGVFYADSDGKPMGDNTKQTRWIINLYNMLDAYYLTLLDVAVAANLLWYPIKGDGVTRIEPDVFVVFGRPKGDRGSYIQSEEGGIAPQVVFEIKSPSNSVAELENKAKLYARYGSEEYYMYDPEKGRLRGWLLKGSVVTELPNMRGWTSPRLGLRFDLDGKDLAVYDPNGKRLLNYNQVLNRFQQAERRASQAEQRIEQTERHVEEVERHAGEVERENARLKELLRQANLNPDDLL